jgi:predicted metal-binding membrane protein
MWMPNRQARGDRRILVTVLLGLVALAWYALWVWSLSPYARFLDHEVLAELPLIGSGDYVLLLSLFVAGWTLMIIAMMLPTSLPLITLFHGMVRQRLNRCRLVTLLIAGYLVVWTGFGGVAHLGDWMVHEAVEHNLWLALHSWLISAAIFLLAGLYQFTPWKYYCLDKCRSPFTFITEHWHGRHDQHEALALGIRHGLFCLGCCWSLMLLMFGVGMGNLGWMLALGVVMALEKNLPWGRQLGKPLGVLLVAWAMALVLVPNLHW